MYFLDPNPRVKIHNYKKYKIFIGLIYVNFCLYRTSILSDIPQIACNKFSNHFQVETRKFLLNIIIGKKHLNIIRT